MKYLDERIILTVPNLTIPEDGLYQYEIGIRDEWLASGPYFVGNCFIPKGSTQRNIDITDIVKNEIDFDKSVDFQADWQVRIKVGENYFYSNAETVLPIYRYPNRKAEMETPIELNKDGWYIPTLQGFDAQKKAKMLPHIPYLSTKELSYELWMNNGKINTTPYLYSGVKKTLDNSSHGIRKNSWTFEDLWKSDTTTYIEPSVTYDSTYFATGEDAFKKYIKIDNLYPGDKDTHINMRIDKLPLFISKIEYYLMNSEDSVIQDAQYTTVPGYWQRHLQIEINDTVTPDTKRSYFDLYLYYGENGDNTFVNPYPELITPFESANVNVRVFLNEQFLDYGTDLVEIPEGATVSNNIITFSDLKSGPYNIHLQDSNGNNLQSVQSYGGFRMNLNPYENASKIVISDIINDKPLKTINIVDTAAFNGLNTIALVWSITNNGTTLQINKNCWEGWIYFDISVKGKEEVKIITPTLNVEEYNPNGYYYNYQTIVPKKGFIDFSNSENYDSYSDNTIKLPFSKEDIDSNEYAGTEKMTIFVQDKLNNVVSNYKRGNFYNGTQTVNTISIRARDLRIIIYVYNDNCDDYHAKIEMNFNMDNYIYGFEFTVDGYNFTINKLMTCKSDNVYTSFPVAEIDYCPARYYLQWRDRYGSMMQRAFTGTSTPKINYTNTEIKNYQSIRRLASSSSQLSFELNSEWIKFELVPYYESIFCSPYLKLYDTQEDQVYNVIVKENEYIEKTFKNNNRQLYSLKLTLEENKTQDIIY